MSDNNGGAEGIDDVLVIGVKDETACHLAYKGEEMQLANAN